MVGAYSAPFLSFEHDSKQVYVVLAFGLQAATQHIYPVVVDSCFGLLEP